MCLVGCQLYDVLVIAPTLTLNTCCYFICLHDERPMTTDDDDGDGDDEDGDDEGPERESSLVEAT
jgi:hypothetical protein